MIEDIGPTIIFPDVNSDGEYKEAVKEICHRELERLLMRFQMAKDKKGKYVGMPNDDVMVLIRDFSNKLIVNEARKYSSPAT